MVAPTRIYVSLNFPANFDLKTVQNVTFSASMIAPRSDEVEQLQCSTNHPIKCDCRRQLEVKTFVTKPSSAEVLLPDFATIKIEPEEISFQNADTTDSESSEDIKLHTFKAEVKYVEETEEFSAPVAVIATAKEPDYQVPIKMWQHEMTRFSYKNPDDLKQLYEVYRNTAENSFLVGKQKIYVDRYKDQVYFANFSLRSKKCDICGLYRRNSAVLAAHRSEHFLQANRCNQCGFMSSSQDLLIKHSLFCVKVKISDVDTIEEEFREIYAKFSRKIKTFPFYESFITEQGTDLHFYQQTKKGSFFMAGYDIRSCKCDICRLEFKSVVALTVHRKLHFFEPGDLNCNACKREFPLEEALGRHSLVCPKSGEIKALTCKFENCNKTFEVFEKQRIHESGHKKGFARKSTQRMCHLCSKVCDDSTVLKAHLRKVHELNPYRCSHCPKFFGEFPQLKYHLFQKHFPDLAEFRCTQCPKVFAIRNRLDAHMKNFHTDQSYPCQFCGRICKNKGSLKIHIQSLHSSVEDRQKFYCKTCGKVFFTKFALQNHTGTHLAPEDWPFACQHCDKKFLNKYRWKEHERIHHGGPLSFCNFCGKSFMTKQYLVDHINLHTVSGCFFFWFS